jgi:FkbM family methyltransferase
MQVLEKLGLYYRFLRTNPPQRAFRLAASRVLLLTGLCRLFTIRLGTISLTFFPTRYAADLWFPAEDVLASYSLPFLRAGDTVVDVGANMGVFTILFARAVGPEGLVIALEPNPTVYGYLIRNVARNSLGGAVHAHNIAAGARDATTYLEDRGTSDTAGAVTDGAGKAFRIQMHRLDALLAALAEKPVRLLKIDTEGYEKFVLEGATQTLSRTDAVIVEVIESNCRRFGYSGAETLGVLSGRGYYLFGLERSSGRFVRCEVDDFMAARDRFSYDLLAVRDPRMASGARWR